MAKDNSEEKKEADEDEAQKKDEPWWLALLGGLIMLGGAVWVYIDLTAFETEGGTRRINWIVAFLYNNLGKWGVVGLMALGGLGATAVGISQLMAKLSGGDDAAAKPKKKRRRKEVEPEE